MCNGHLQVTTLNSRKKVKVPNFFPTTPFLVSYSPSLFKKKDNLWAWPFYDHFCSFFCQLHEYVSQNLSAEGHFEVLNASKAQLDQKLASDNIEQSEKSQSSNSFSATISVHSPATQIARTWIILFFLRFPFIFRLRTSVGSLIC